MLLGLFALCQQTLHKDYLLPALIMLYTIAYIHTYLLSLVHKLIHVAQVSLEETWCEEQRPITRIRDKKSFGTELSEIHTQRV